MSNERAEPRAELVRGLGVWDGVLLTVGSVIGTGIFLVSSDIAKVLPHGGMLLAVWLAGGLLSLAGALTYAELGAMFPRAGGIYLFLKEAYGPLPGFLYGWSCFLVMMSGGPGHLRRADDLQAFRVHQVEVADQVGGRDHMLGGADRAGHGAADPRELEPLPVAFEQLGND